jgi:hypothetical protein
MFIILRYYLCIPRPLTLVQSLLCLAPSICPAPLSLGRNVISHHGVDCAGSGFTVLLPLELSLSSGQPSSASGDCSVLCVSGCIKLLFVHHPSRLRSYPPLAESGSVLGDFEQSLFALVSSITALLATSLMSFFKFAALDAGRRLQLS